MNHLYANLWQPVRRLALGVGGPFLAHVAIAQQCQPNWSDGFPSGTLSLYGAAENGVAVASFEGDVSAAIPPLLAVAGNSSVRLWDGRSWVRSNGSVGLGLVTGVRALAWFDPDGPGPARPVLVAGGDFTSIAGVSASRAAYWDGQAWRAFGAPLSGPVNTILSFDPDGQGPELPQLIVAGEFTSPDRIARSDGFGAWLPLGAGLNGVVYALAALDGGAGVQLIAGGAFTQSGGNAVSRIAHWDGAQWQAVGGGIAVSGIVRCLASFDPDGDGPAVARLIAAGSLTAFGSVAVQNIGQLDGTQWTPMGPGLNGEVSSMCVSLGQRPGHTAPPMLFVGGAFTAAGGEAIETVAAWDGNTWQHPASIQPLSGSSTVRSVATLRIAAGGDTGEDVYAAGQLTLTGYAGGSPSAVARLRDSRWRRLGNGFRPGISTPTVSALAVHDLDGRGPASPRIFAFGNFSAAGETPCGGAAVLDGERWSWAGVYFDANGGPPFVIAALSFQADPAGVLPPLLVAAGAFSAVNSQPARSLASWDGTAWSEFGGGANRGVYALARFDPDGPGPESPLLVAGGAFTEIGTTAANFVAAWNGTGWIPFGNGPGAPVWGLYAWDEDGPGPAPPALVAGTYTSGSSGRILRWDGATWTQLGGSTVTYPQSIVAFDEDGDGPLPPTLFVGSGNLSSTVAVRKLVGDSWQAAGNIGGRSAKLMIFDDDGAGPNPPALYAAGNFGASTSPPPWPPDIPHGVARWDGTAWHNLTGGVFIRGGQTDGVWAIAQLDRDGALGPQPPTLYLGGDFHWCGDDYTAHFAAWVGCDVAPACLGDANGDRTVDTDDLDLALRSFGSEVLTGTFGDVDYDGDVDQDDVDTILFSFGMSCS